MTCNKKSEDEYSRDVYNAFQAIAVTTDMIQRRRHACLLQETLWTAWNQVQGSPKTSFIVGSQIEGSTTIGMESDLDTVMKDDRVQVVLKQGTWQSGKNQLLAFKDKTTPPQFYKMCRLQPTPDGRQGYKRVPAHDTDVVDEKGRVLLSNRIVDSLFEDTFKGWGLDMIKHGPARCVSADMDCVYEFPCNSLPEECEFLFKRSRLGHFPKPETLDYARRCPVFFIPQGHPYSHQNERELQWRLSTTLTERALMFDFTEVQLLVYILLKMLKNEYIKPEFGDNFSTFHVKTALMFTIEQLPPEIFQIENIILCATNCIKILIQWAHNGVCPHFTMDGVNLFDGKLSKEDTKKLMALLTNINKDIMRYICNMKMDMFGMQVLHKVHVPCYITKHEHEIEVLKMILERTQVTKYGFVIDVNTQATALNVQTTLACVTNILGNFRALQTHESELQREVADIIVPYVCGTLANIMASLCISSRQSVSQDILNLYQFSFEWDLVSDKLKYASMLYCSGQYDQAADMLNHCESQLVPDVAHYCICHGRMYLYQTYKFVEKCLSTNKINLFKTSSTLCIKFCKHERPCVPEHLQYEMYRTQTQRDKDERIPQHAWMDLIVIDCLPFLYYLQYLVYRQKCNLSRKLLAIFNLMDYLDKSRVEVEFDYSIGHVDTVLHVLAHCWELENRPDVAWHLYQQSINMFPANNIAWVHLIQLFRQYFL